MPDHNGPAPTKALELKELLTIETEDGRSLEFEVVGTLADEESGETFAVLVHGGDEEGESDEEAEFIVTDSMGNLLEDEDLAQEILDEFLLFAEEAEESEEGEPT
ncbi:MAG TPA: hypothetical protein VMV73_02590 [Candidatus Dormibacteraeota bacterium]|nr:hypothetical protein [Candidatus Dormibacteraeota bacterium]